MGLFLVSLALLAFGIPAILGGVLICMKSGYLSDWELFGGALVLVGAITVCIGILVPTTTLGQRAYGRNACGSYGRQTDRVVKFVVLNSLDTGTCMVQTTDRRWLPQDQVQEISGKLSPARK